MFYIGLLLVTSAVTCDGYDILLMFPVPGKSHAILGDGYVTHLLEAGHNITYITPLPMRLEHPSLRQIDVSKNVIYFSKDIFSISNIIESGRKILDYEYVIPILATFWNETLHLDTVQMLLNDPREKFDAVVVEWLYVELGAGLATVFDCPLVWSSSMMPHTFVMYLIEEHLNPAYTFHLHSQQRPFTFLERVKQLWTVLHIRYYLWSHMNQYEAMHQSIYRSAMAERGRILASYDEVRYNASFMLGNGNVIISDAISLPRNYVDIGGYHIKKYPEPLPQNLHNIMERATNGVIYFSLGSLLKMTSTTDEFRKDILNVLASTNRTVIWNSDSAVPNLPDNVHMVNWAPQQSILAHPNCILFITHAGLLSITESIYYGKPVIGLPFFADQYNNINRASEKGFGKMFDFLDNPIWKLKEVINEILEDSRYENRAKEISTIYHDKLTSPSEELVFWISHTIRTRGASHLRASSLKVEWYKKLYLDLAAVIFIAIGTIFIGIKYLLGSPQKISHPKID